MLNYDQGTSYIENIIVQANVNARFCVKIWTTTSCLIALSTNWVHALHRRINYWQLLLLIIFGLLLVLHFYCFLITFNLFKLWLEVFIVIAFLVYIYTVNLKVNFNLLLHRGLFIPDWIENMVTHTFVFFLIIFSASSCSFRSIYFRNLFNSDDCLYLSLSTASHIFNNFTCLLTLREALLISTLSWSIDNWLFFNTTSFSYGL